MTTITDEYMYEMLQKTKEYTIVLLKPGPKMDHPDLKKIIWEHGRRNFALRADGKIAIVGPVTAETGVSGLYIFNCDADESRTIIEGDPAIVEGIFTFEVHPCRSFPGDKLG
jgi:hypothetical protein